MSLLPAAALALTALLGQGYYTPEEAQQLFVQGNQAFERKDYVEATRAWEKLVDHGFGGADVLYNLGTAALRQGDLGRAVLYLERARRLGPAEPDLLANLEAARKQQGDQVVGAGGGEPFIQRVARATPRDIPGYVFLGAWVGGAVLLLLFRRLPKKRRAWAGVLAGLLLLVAVPSGAIFAAHAVVAHTVREGVVMQPTVQARELPTPASNVAFEVHAGLKVRLLETEGAWVRIRLPNGLVGWAEQEGITQI